MASGVLLVYYTDPYCVDSWLWESARRRLVQAYGARLTWRNILVGTQPRLRAEEAGGGPLAALRTRWQALARSRDLPLDWTVLQATEYGPSHPACIGIKAAQLQGPRIEARVLRRFREAVLTAGLDLAKPGLREQAVASVPGISADAYRDDLYGGTAEALARADWEQARALRLGDAPTTPADDRRRIATPSVQVFEDGAARGWLPLEPERPEAAVAALRRLCRSLPVPQGPQDLEQLFRLYRTLTAAEAVVLSGLSPRDALNELRRLLRRGEIARRPVQERAIWQAVELRVSSLE